MASLPTGSVTFPTIVHENGTASVTEPTMRMMVSGVRPETELFDLSRIHGARWLIDTGLMNDRPHVQAVLERRQRAGLCRSARCCPASEDTRLDHHERIRCRLGFARCGEAGRRRLLDHMVTTAQTVPRAAMPYPLACRWLLEQRVKRRRSPGIADLGGQTLCKINRGAPYPGLDPILAGMAKTHLIGPAWDGVVRLVASINPFGQRRFDLERMRRA